MPNYLIAIRVPTAQAAPTGPPTPEGLEAWGTWFSQIGPNLVDAGNPVFDRRTLGNAGGGTSLGGYTFVSADDLDAAVGLAQGCPALADGGGVEVGEITPIM